MTKDQDAMIEAVDSKRDQLQQTCEAKFTVLKNIIHGNQEAIKELGLEIRDVKRKYSELEKDYDKHFDEYHDTLKIMK